MCILIAFRKGCDTVHAMTLMNDFICHLKHADSPLYTCSLDAVKCLDLLCHDGLLVKLKQHNTYRFMASFIHVGYCNQTVIIKWNVKIYYDMIFNMIKDTCQTSYYLIYLSLIFYMNANSGIMFIIRSRISTILQFLPQQFLVPNISSSYLLITVNQGASHFVLKRCLILDEFGRLIHHQFSFILGQNVISNVESLGVPGVRFTWNGNIINHAQSRIIKCRNSSFVLSDFVMCYPGLTSDTKSYILNIISQYKLFTWFRIYSSK